MKRYISGRKSSLVYEISKTLAEVATKNNEEQNDLKKQYLNMNGICEYCEHNPTGKGTGDHFKPLVANKMPTRYCNEPINIIPVCSRCNSSKGGKDFFDWYTKSAYCCAFPEEVHARVLAKMKKYAEVFEEHHTAKLYPNDKVEELIEEIGTFLNGMEDRVREIIKETHYKRSR